MFRVEFVVTENNKKPFDDFIESLSLIEQADIFVAINKFCELKNNNIIISSKRTKYVREGIYELKVNHKNKITRSFYFYYIDQRMVFTHGFVKKTDKLPINEIEKAIKLKNELISNSEK